ncbi:MAG TPA: hypothetical protein VGS07_25950 [Thermoanaerobaculia bacterium]|jgi:hypothetical protein|nr:hypothetical protein [Thermoanaerobaculia bacterium]
MIRKATLALALTALLWTGCSAQLGPRTIPHARADYGAALVHSWDEQLLLNLVRLRYRDNPLFLEVGSVVTHYSVAAGASASAQVTAQGSDTLASTLGANLSYIEEPTITYAPLQGDDFVSRLLSPISPANLVLLSQSGWSIERLLLCCVQKVNGLRNATGAAGPTPDYAPPFAEFHRLAKLLRRLQVAGLIEATVADDGKTVSLLFNLAPPGPLADQSDEARKLLGIDGDITTLRVTPATIRKGKDEVAVAGRSLLSVLFYFSQAVEVPAEDEKAGRVTVTLKEDGQRFDWLEATGSLMRIRSAAAQPASAAVKVRYRGSWFYIADDDLNSKTTFNLLTYLFALKAGSHQIKEPLLTLGIQ